MPLDCKQIIELHKTFNSPDGIEARGVSKMVNLAVYLSGPAMSSTESSAERRGELVELINDQAQRGIHQTITKLVEKPDPITGEKRQVSVVEIVRDAKGLPMRQQGSILEQYGIHLQPISIERIKYSPEVEAQIVERQKATQQVQLAQANARKAEQDAITTAKQGEASAAKAKWEQETIKAKLVTEAQQKLEVATLGAKEAEAYKREQILRGEGDSERRKLLLSADGALDQKLEAYKQVQSIWATSFANFKGNMVPGVQMGGSGGTAVSSAQSLVDLLTAKTARDLNLDLSMPTAKK
jgi:regulator of protease activity HflC (stomatin/prohibitin superfamily)